MKKICLLLAIMLMSSTLSSFAEEITVLPAPEFELVVLDKLDENMYVDDEINTPDDEDSDTLQDNDQDEGTPFDDETEEKEIPDKDNEEADTEQDSENVPDDKEENEEEIKSTPDGEEENKENGNEIMPLFITPLIPPTIDDVYVDANSGIVEIVINGVALDGTTVGMKIVPLGNEGEIAYIRQIVIDGYSGCFAVADLSESSSQLFKLTVDAGDLGRFERIFTCGEAEKLKCTRTVSGIKIEATADIPTEQDIAVKILNSEGTVQYIGQKKTDSNGSYSINVSLPSDDKYIVYVTEGLTGRQFIRSVGKEITSDVLFTAKQSIGGKAGEYKEALLYAKNIDNTSKYTYELKYDSSVLSVKNMDLLKGHVKVKSFERGRIVFTSDNRSMSDYVWSGTINGVQFELLQTVSSTEISINIYESEN